MNVSSKPYFPCLHPGGGTGRPSGSVARAGAVAGRCDGGADDAPREQDAPGAAAALCVTGHTPLFIFERGGSSRISKE